MNSTKEIINAIITEKRFSDKITADMSLSDDLGFDSLSLVELIVDLEDKFDIVIEESDLDPAQIKYILLLTNTRREGYAVRIYKA